MDVNEIITALNRVLELCDQLDQTGFGVKGITDGEHTTRESCKVELYQFLLYIADGCSYVTDTQAALLGVVFEKGALPASGVKEMAKRLNVPDPDKSITMIAFRQADQAISQQNGSISSSLTDLVVSIYDMFGQLMVSLNENPTAKSRFDTLINRYKAGIASDSFTTSAGSKKADTAEKQTTSSTKAGESNEKNGTNMSPAEKPSTVRFDDAITFELFEGYTFDKMEGMEDYRIGQGWVHGDFGYIPSMMKKDIEILPGEKPLDAVHRLKQKKEVG